MLIKKRGFFRACAKALDISIILLVKIKNTNYIAILIFAIAISIFEILCSIMLNFNNY